MRKSMLLCVCILLSSAANGQMVTLVDASTDRGDVVDKIDYEVVYDLDAMVPSKKDTTKYSERMLLQMGPSRSAFFSYVAFQVDSVVEAQLRHGDNVNIKANAKVSWRLYKNVPDSGVTAYLDRVCSDNFRVVEKMETPDWSFVADSVQDILGYRCRLAEAQFKGRHWMAWYAVDLPIDNGPWKLQGLPGLILKSYDSNREFTFTAVGLTHVGGSRNIYYKGGGYTAISRKDLNKIYKRYYDDAIGYLFMTYPQSSTNRVTVVDQDGNELKHSKPVAYNLIER